MDNGVPWLAAYTRPRHEDKVKQFCEERGIEVFLPCYRSWRRWSDRKKLVFSPIFPSYVFVRAAQTATERAVRAPGLLWFVRDSRGLAPVKDAELAAVRALVSSGLKFDSIPGLSLGAEAEIVKGPLRGHRGVLVRRAERCVILQISAIESSIRVELPDPTWVQALRPH